MTSPHDQSFARLAASTHASQFGEGLEAVGYETPDGTARLLSFVVVSDEKRTWRKEQFGTHLIMVREGWLVSDPERKNYSGTSELRVGSTLEIGGAIYTIEAVTNGQHIIEFRAIRAGEIEVFNPNFRGR